MGRINEGLEPSLGRTLRSIKPLIVNACGPVAESLHEVEERYGVHVEDAEIEISFAINASSGAAFIASQNQESSIKIKIRLSPSSDARV